MQAYLARQNGHPVYVGATTQPLKARIAQHCSKAKRGSTIPLHAAMAKDPKSFSWEVVAECNDLELLLLIEQEAIAKHETHITLGGFNCNYGGNGISEGDWKPEARAHKRII